MFKGISIFDKMLDSKPSKITSVEFMSTDDHWRVRSRVDTGYFAAEIHHIDEYITGYRNPPNPTLQRY